MGCAYNYLNRIICIVFVIFTVILIHSVKNVLTRMDYVLERSVNYNDTVTWPDWFQIIIFWNYFGFHQMLFIYVLNEVTSFSDKVTHCFFRKHELCCGFIVIGTVVTFALVTYDFLNFIYVLMHFLCFSWNANHSVVEFFHVLIYLHFCVVFLFHPTEVVAMFTYDCGYWWVGN
jgi:hypothetical protein